ncbi:MAG: ABC transporter ATP-binding protein [Actinomycetota bacterium]|jgi:ABC-type nitrate/sulfonate/bicarbonate transport system ATPase subunit|nr:ABC transporter ATP-binding protein [Actinomycetota bacterium]
MTSPVLLELSAVAKTFGDQVVLAPTDLRIEEGSFVAIVGPSGCGKSTLFNIIAGLLEPDTGAVLLQGRNVIGATGHVGYMLQKDLLVPWRSVEDNITMAAHLTRKVTDADRLEARQIAQKYGLGEFLDHYPKALSGGMRQRVAFMRTLVTHQQLLLLDEPFGALDAQTRLDMQRWLLDVWRESGRTVLFITHDVDESIFLSDRILVMSPRPGRVVADLENPLSRPRDLDVLTDPTFVALKSRIMHLLHGGER